MVSTERLMQIAQIDKTIQVEEAGRRSRLYYELSAFPRLIEELVDREDPIQTIDQIDGMHKVVGVEDGDNDNNLKASKGTIVVMLAWSGREISAKILTIHEITVECNSDGIIKIIGGMGGSTTLKPKEWLINADIQAQALRKAFAYPATHFYNRGNGRMSSAWVLPFSSLLGR